MFRWLALAGLAWAAMLFLFVAGLQRSASAPRPAPPPPARTGAAAADDRPALDGEGWRWKVIRATSAHRVMIVDVEALRVEDARAIAVQVVEPVRSHGYDEILIYVRKSGAGSGPARRVQWTPAGGYTEMALEP